MKACVNSRLLVCVAVVALMVGCGTTRSGEELPGAAAGRSGAVVDPAKIEACAGFAPDAAAAIVGVPAADLESSNTLIHATLRVCSFQSRRQASKSLSFSLGWEANAEEAAVEMARLRENAGVARDAVGVVTGSSEQKPASHEIPGIGDEAVYVRINDTVNVRVANVIVQVNNAPDLEAQKKVAQLVVSGLR
jgi:hypothetical protein